MISNIANFMSREDRIRIRWKIKLILLLLGLRNHSLLDSTSQPIFFQNFENRKYGRLKIIQITLNLLRYHSNSDTYEHSVFKANEYIVIFYETIILTNCGFKTFSSDLKSRVSSFNLKYIFFKLRVSKKKCIIQLIWHVFFPIYTFFFKFQ